MQEMVRGSRFDLTKRGCNKILVRIEYKFKPRSKARNLNFMALECNSNGKCLDDKHSMFFGNISDPENAVSHLGFAVSENDAEEFLIKFKKIAVTVEKVDFLAVTNRPMSSDMIESMSISILDIVTGEELMRFIPNASSAKNFLLVSLYRYQGEWKCFAAGNAVEDFHKQYEITGF